MNYSSNIKDISSHPKYHGRIRFGMYIGHYNELLHYDMLDAWWKGHNVLGPTKLQTPQDSTFIVFNGDTPVGAVSIILTNTKDYCFVENLITSPSITDARLKVRALKKLDIFATAFVKRLGYRKLIGMVPSSRPRQYETMGFKPGEKVNIMIREVV